MSTTAITLVSVANTQLETVSVDGEGLVTVRSLLAPFSKDADNQLGRLQSWANLQKVRLPSRNGDGKTAGNLTPWTWCIHHRQAAMAIAELDTRGMTDEVRAKHLEFKRLCADVLADYFAGKATAVLQLDCTIANSARVSDDPFAVVKLRLACQRVANAKGCTIHRVYGYVRKTQHLSSPFALSLVLLDHVIRSLEELEIGPIALLSPKDRRLLIAARKWDGQTTINFGSN